MMASLTSKMRAACFVNKLEFEMNGNVMKDALVLGDADNDQRNELVVGNVLGDLAVYKGGAGNKPWLAMHGLGMITSILIGDITNSQKNSLIVISGEGFCYIFDATPSVQDEDSQRKMRVTHVQQLPSSTKVTILADIDNDGNVELVIGLSDRVVRSYRWTPMPHATSGEGVSNYSLVPLNKWELANQIGSVSMHSNSDNTACLLVAQPGAMYVRLQSATTVVDKSKDAKELMLEQLLEYLPVTRTKLRNPNITTEILGNVQCERGRRAIHFAVATLDGLLMLVNGDNGHTVWSMQLDHQLFCLCKLDVTNDGHEEVIVSSWDGQTFIVDQNQNAVRFQFDERISAFTAGKFSLLPGTENVACVVYATLSNRIVLYHDVQFDRLPLTTLVDTIKTTHPQIEELLRQLKIELSSFNDVTRNAIYRYCLYGRFTNGR